MKIIQSFAQFEEGSPYLQHHNKPDYVYLSFYCFLLSQITVKKLYGDFTMFCNRKAYDSMLRYIPYDNVQIMENHNKFKMWSMYKVDVMRIINDDFIHLDPDVSIFSKVLDPFINGECDVMVQDIVPFEDNRLKKFVFDNIDFFAETKILTKPFDGRAFSCGTVGIKKFAQEYYFKGVEVLYEGMEKRGIEYIDYPTLILEEQLLYLIACENFFSVQEIIPTELITEYGIMDGGDRIGYLHLWRAVKYKTHIIDMIRKKIFFDFPEYYDTVLKYEREVLSKFNFFPYFKLPMLYG